MVHRLEFHDPQCPASYRPCQRIRDSLILDVWDDTGTDDLVPRSRMSPATDAEEPSKVKNESISCDSRQYLSTYLFMLHLQVETFNI